ncbi:MAG: aspartate aminotransferase [Planctomycetes bacterium DG_23]|nr:MAG: aspartate aminotransferase [Planctomycetes bacterium DG_23]
MFAKRMAQINSSGIRKVFDLAQDLQNPVNFSIGQPDFDVPQEIKARAISAIEQGFNKYTLTQGIPELRERVRAHIKETRNFQPEAVLITSGVSGGLLLASMALIDPGDEVLLLDPYFVMYKHLTGLVGGIPKFVNTYGDFRLRPEALEEVLSEKTKMVLFNSPNNPTGITAREEELKTLASFAKRHNLFIIADEIYDHFVYDGPYRSISAYTDNLLLLGGFSKTYAMTGWRLGYAAGPADLIGEMTKLQQFSFVCAPAMVQQAALVAFDLDVSRFQEEYRKKRNLIYEGLKGVYDVVRPDGAFYIFPEVPWGKDEEFVAEAIRKNLLIIPGSVFSERNTHFRISYATSNENIEKGIEILRSLAGG